MPDNYDSRLQLGERDMSVMSFSYSGVASQFRCFVRSLCRHLLNIICLNRKCASLQYDQGKNSYLHLICLTIFSFPGHILERIHVI